MRANVLAGVVEKPKIPFCVQYVDLEEASLGLRDPALVLGVVGYGTDRPCFLPPDCPFIAAPLRPIGGGGVLEVWSTATPRRPYRFGSVTGAASDNLAFGAVRLPISATVSLEAIVEQAYLEIFDFMEATGFSEPVRVWNYLTGIIAEEDGLQRYMRFNIGRHRAYAARLRQAVPPPASGVGGNEGESIIYFLAGRTPARAIENPRQISAYHYPPVYGPSSPRFSRASVYAHGHAEAMFISGTASIVGHETRHPDDLKEQIAETRRNLNALIGTASHPAGKNGEWSAKIYLQNGDDCDAVSPAVDAVFGAQTPRLFLQGDICRTGLRLEIEAFRRPDLDCPVDQIGSTEAGLRPA